MTQKIQIRLVFIIFLIGKFFLCMNLLRILDLQLIYIVEMSFLLTSCLFTGWIIAMNDITAMTMMIIIDCCYSVYMVFNHFRSPDVLFYFHYFIGFLYLTINKKFIHYRWLNIIINLYMGSVFIRNYIYFPDFGKEHYMIAVLSIIIINLLVWEVKCDRLDL